MHGCSGLNVCTSTRPPICPRPVRPATWAKSWNVRGAIARALGTLDVLTGRTDGIAAPYRRAALENVERLNAQRRLAAERLSIDL